MVTSLVILGAIVAALAVFFFSLFPLARGAIWVPSTSEKAELLAALCEAGPGERAADLGAGDGRVVIALARRGAEAHGFEVNPLLVVAARWNIRRAGVGDHAFIHWKSFWRADLSGFTAITIFQGSAVMRRLEAKLRRELVSGARVVSDYWGFPTLPPVRIYGTVYCYRIGASVWEA
ncbi:MAG TPA: hypothetical protein VHE79_14015 [Spirochaetia bacterium]